MTRYPTLSALFLAGISALLLPDSAHADEAASPAITSAPSAAVAALIDLETRAPKDWSNAGLIVEFNAEVIRFVGANQLQTGEDYLRAAVLLEKDMGDFRTIRTRYETMLTAAALGEASAASGLGMAWDFFLAGLGRPLRIDANGLSANNPEFFSLDPSPACIQAVLRDPAGARARQAAATDNPEILAIRDADQAIRQTDWNNRTEEQRKADMASDLQRLARMREIITAGDVRTANDFARAALVMQHSARFPGFQLAHELAVCSLLLGDRGTGRWLVAASYDRLLHSVGHDQRFSTQYGPGGLRSVDETGICDNQRRALGCPTLADAKARGSKHSVSLTDKDNAITDSENKVSFIYPSGWKLVGNTVAGANATSLRFTHPEYKDASLTVYYRMQALPTDAAGPEAGLRAQAAAKEEDRRNRMPDYRNQPESFRYREVAGRPCLSWIGRFTEDGSSWDELLIRVAGPNSNVLIFLQAPAGNLVALRPSIEAMADTLKLP